MVWVGFADSKLGLCRHESCIEAFTTWLTPGSLMMTVLLGRMAFEMMGTPESRAGEVVLQGSMRDGILLQDCRLCSELDQVTGGGADYRLACFALESVIFNFGRQRQIHLGSECTLRALTPGRTMVKRR